MLVGAVSIACTLVLSVHCAAQQPVWRPSRVPANNARHIPETRQLTRSNNSFQTSTLSDSALSSGATSDRVNDQEHLGSGVVLRWKSSSATQNSTRSNEFQSHSANTAGTRHTGGLSEDARSALFDNPLRSTRPQQASPSRFTAARGDFQRVRPANYQQLTEPGAQGDPFGDERLSQPSFPPRLPDETTPQNNAGPGNTLGELPALPDPLRSPEPAPGPDSILRQDSPPNPFPGNDRSELEPSASDQSRPEIVPVPNATEDADTDDGPEDDDLDLPRRRKNDANSISCNELRDRVRARPLSDVSIDISPSFGEGLHSVKKDTDKQRLDFAANSEIRDWSDYTGMIVATGRLIDLRNDRVMIDVGGSERSLLLRDLSDVDVAYVGESWNIPLKCGTGNEPFEGRNFIASTVQWKAPGTCHKPLYFQQPQLERYGHEMGPVLQPLASTAHFFGNILVLPYKMGIHPPSECQYPLGYFRPGNCAPYMVQPIPWSLRGAAVQAAAMTGVGALIP